MIDTCFVLSALQIPWLVKNTYYNYLLRNRIVGQALNGITMAVLENTFCLHNPRIKI